jgi:uracil-DNA glycosylase family 4
MTEDNDTWEESIACPFCHTTEMVFPSGPADAEILIIGDAPGADEIGKGRPMTGPMGLLLKQELGRVGIDFRMCRKTNLWLHVPNKDIKCFQYCMDMAIKEAKGRKAILLLGAEPTKVFCGVSVSTVSGLKVTSPYLSAPLIVAMYNPASIFQKGGVVGEVRLALEKFALHYEALG